MAFVKLDCGLLDSSLWVDVLATRVFTAALLMAVPRETTEPMPQLAVTSLDQTGWFVPAGWFGFVAAAGIGIVRRALVDEVEGLAALERLGAPDLASRNAAHEGRRLVRVDGGFLVLNFQVFRDKDHTSTERSRRFRERRRAARDTKRIAAKKNTRAVVDQLRQRQVPAGVDLVTGEDHA